VLVLLKVGISKYTVEKTLGGMMYTYQVSGMNEYNSPSFVTMFQRALLNTCITTCFGLNPSHHQVLSYTEY
jgi:hypothetical protein